MGLTGEDPETLFSEFIDQSPEGTSMRLRWTCATVSYTPQIMSEDPEVNHYQEIRTVELIVQKWID